jgi:hypothetical protein
MLLVISFCCMQRRGNILPRVNGSVTNSNRFWIGLLDLLTPSLTVSLNHNQFTITHSQSSAEPFFLACRGLAPFSFSDSFDSVLYHLYNLKAVDICEPHRKHLFLYCCIYSALHRNQVIRLLSAYSLSRECVY